MDAGALWYPRLAALDEFPTQTALDRVACSVRRGKVDWVGGIAALRFVRSLNAGIEQVITVSLLSRVDGIAISRNTYHGTRTTLQEGSESQ